MLAERSLHCHVATSLQAFAVPGANGKQKITLKSGKKKKRKNEGRVLDPELNS